MRFATGGVASNSLPNPAELIAQLEEEKRRKEERAAKFGTVAEVGDTRPFGQLFGARAAIFVGLCAVSICGLRYIFFALCKGGECFV